MNDDAVLEAELRAFLARRAPSAPPAALGETVRERLRSDPGAPRFGWVRPAAGVLAGLAAIVVLAVIALGGRGIGPGPGASPSPEVPPPLVTGDGVVEAFPPILQVGLAVAALAGLVVLAARTRNRWLGYAAVIAAIGILWVGSMIGTSDAVESGNGAFTVSPRMVDRPGGFEEGVFVDADGDVEFRVVIGISNTSRLPLDLLGMQVPASNLPDPTKYPGLIALGYMTDDNCCLASQARPFSRLTLQPGGFVQIVVMARTGMCATSTVESGAQVIESVPLVYEQLTIQHVQDVALPEQVDVLVRDGC